MWFLRNGKMCQTLYWFFDCFVIPSNTIEDTKKNSFPLCFVLNGMSIGCALLLEFGNWFNLLTKLGSLFGGKFFFKLSNYLID